MIKKNKYVESIEWQKKQIQKAKDRLDDFKAANEDVLKELRTLQNQVKAEKETYNTYMEQLYEEQKKINEEADTPEEVDAEVLPPDGDQKVPAGVAMIGHVDEADQDLEAEEAV